MIRLALVSLAVVGLVKPAQGMPTYGVDDRMNLHQVIDPSIHALAESVAIFLLDSRPLGGYYRFNFSRFENGGVIRVNRAGEWSMSEFPFSPKERFYGEPQLSDGWCSAALIGPDLVLTAGHCVDEEICPRLKVLFDFVLDEHGRVSASRREDEVYQCGQVKGVWNPGGEDWALIRLTKTVKNRRPLPINTTGARIKPGTQVFTMGYPYSVPLKVSSRATVRSNQPSKNLFLADLDVMPGNSGGPVFNAKTLLIEGVVSTQGHSGVARRKDGTMISRPLPNDSPAALLTRVTGIHAVLPYLYRRLLHPVVLPEPMPVEDFEYFRGAKLFKPYP